MVSGSGGVDPQAGLAAHGTLDGLLAVRGVRWVLWGGGP